MARKVPPVGKPSPDHVVSRRRADALYLIHNPQQIADPAWHARILWALREYVWDNPMPELTARDIATLVDDEIGYCEQDGETKPVAVARQRVADMLGRPRVTVKSYHVRYGARGVRNKSVAK